MNNNRITLKEAVKFHGHLGPYLVLGLMAGNIALKKLKCKKYFGLDVLVWGANQRPKSCLIDGLQLSSGATYGKGNIQKIDGKRIRILFKNLDSKRNIEISLKEGLIEQLNKIKGHKVSENFAKELFKSNPLNLFNLTGE
ncbi:MAG: formylmethanofuran dehydrogenase subunit E family protein [Candidatus Omnitrophica bacterium]|nr:formylmethanofuran dehydrogenase subunit E family protein [Candidatus Omnitrophota bacterium]